MEQSRYRGHQMVGPDGKAAGAPVRYQAIIENKGSRCVCLKNQQIKINLGNEQQSRGREVCGPFCKHLYP
jgi:hypothetical protein